MVKKRTVITYGTYFEDFLKQQSPKVQWKILQILRIVEEIEMIPRNYLKHLKGTNGLYEIRVLFGQDCLRIFCFFDTGKLVVLLSGFRKKSQKTPKSEIEKAVKLMADYFKEKNT